MSASYFGPLKTIRLEDFRVTKLASEGVNFSCLGLKRKDFLLQGGGDNATRKHMSAAGAVTASLMILGRAPDPGRAGAARVTCRAAVASSAAELGGAGLGEGWPGWSAGEGRAPLQQSPQNAGESQRLVMTRGQWERQR